MGASVIKAKIYKTDLGLWKHLLNTARPSMVWSSATILVRRAKVLVIVGEDKMNDAALEQAARLRKGSCKLWLSSIWGGRLLRRDAWVLLRETTSGLTIRYHME